jgi:pyrimidine-specific ribonucleoside hydrolase
VSPIPVIIDCDPGHDDALAITLALARPELQVLGITTVGGNATLANTTRNALRILALLGRTDVPVAAGSPDPLVRPLETAPAPVTLVPVGPLTNIARLLRTYPGIADKIGHISLMGGGMVHGNWTPAAEFNIWVDPEAARIVFRSGLPITMHGLDVTHKALFGYPEIERLDAIGNRVGRVFGDLMRFFVRFHVEHYGVADTPIHDAVAVAHVALPGLVTTQPHHVDVAVDDGITRGMTVVDRRPMLGITPNVDVALDIDRAGFADLMIAAVASYR